VVPFRFKPRKNCKMCAEAVHGALPPTVADFYPITGYPETILG